MKLQNLVIIFLALALPVIIILSVYVGLQVKTAFLRANYDDALIDASHQTVTAFQLNTTNNKYLTVADTKIRDIEAALNIFSSTLSTKFGRTGANRSSMMAYVPALMFTLYDGYYIYTPVKDWDNGAYSHELKAYVYYSKQYTSENGDKVLEINYSLDNYVAVYYYENGKIYQSKAGYLEEIPKDKDKFKDLLLTKEAIEYYENAWIFTEWFNNIVHGMKTDETDKLKISDKNLALPGEVSTFNDEKYEVIKGTITNNLIQAMENYSKHSSGEFRMPELTGTDWDTILNNACFISFMQGIPVGTSNYNNYAIVASSENKEMVNENSIYYINIDENGPVTNGSYHRIWCDKLDASNDSIIVRI